MNSKMDQINKKRLFTFLWAFFYLIIVALIVATSCLMFNKFYYEFYYVDGKSMYPTLNANEQGNKNKDFGIIDSHRNVFDHLSRYDIVITYYQDDYVGGKLSDNASRKIKRIIGFPGEKIVTFPRGFAIFKDGYEPEEPISYEGEHYYINGEKFALSTLPFTPNPESYLKESEYTLTKAGVDGATEDEFFVVGDNWGISKDSTTVGPVTKKMMTGVLIAIEGVCDVNQSTLKAYNFRYHWPVYYKR